MTEIKVAITEAGLREIEERWVGRLWTSAKDKEYAETLIAAALYAQKRVSELRALLDQRTVDYGEALAKLDALAEERAKALNERDAARAEVERMRLIVEAAMVFRRFEMECPLDDWENWDESLMVWRDGYAALNRLRRTVDAYRAAQEPSHAD